MRKNNAAAGLYLHIPFCLRKCLYCDFCSYAGYGEDTISAYVDQLCRELRDRAHLLHNREIDTVYFGGGTPTLLAPAHFSHLLDTIHTHYRIAPNAEITTECNPATTDADKLTLMRRMGINRLSIGAQSAVDSELHALGRIHNFADTVRTVHAARSAGFENLSLDLMYGIPAQTRRSFAHTLRAALSLAPEHLSVYSLIVEEHTPFWDARDTLPLPDEDTVCDMTGDTIRMLNEAGYHRYEISNFARPGFFSRHNLHYWHMEDYLGVGIAAHSLIGDIRLQNRPTPEAYLLGEDITEQEERLTPDIARDEYTMLRMRLVEGVDKAAFAARFGVSFDALYGKTIARFSHTGLLIDTPAYTAFTEAGFAVSNTILSEMLFQ